MWAIDLQWMAESVWEGTGVADAVADGGAMAKK